MGLLRLGSDQRSGAPRLAGHGLGARRPPGRTRAVTWVCGAAFAFKFILGPAAVVAMAMVGHAITLPEFDFTEMSTILLAMLGLGGLRTVEKVKGL